MLYNEVSINRTRIRGTENCSSYGEFELWRSVYKGLFTNGTGKIVRVKENSSIKVRVGDSTLIGNVSVSSTGQKLLDLCSEEGEILSARFSSDGKYVITMVKKCVKIWNIAKRKVSWTIEDAKGFQV